MKLREAHNPEVAGSNPAPATMKTRLLTGFLFMDILRSFYVNLTQLEWFLLAYLVSVELLFLIVYQIIII